jgi:integrase
MSKMSGLSLADAVHRWEAAMERAQLPEGTRKQYRSTCRRLRDAYPNRKLSSVGSSELTEFLYGEPGIANGKAEGTGTNYRCALRHLFAYAEAMGWTKAVSIPDPAMKSKKRGNGSTFTRLTAAQLQLVVSIAQPPAFRAMLVTAISTALRISDILSIRLRDVNLVTGELYVSVQKTGVSDVLPVTMDLDRELRAYLAWRDAQRELPALEPDSYIFHGWRQRGSIPGQQSRLRYEARLDRHVSYNWASTRLRDLFARCGVSVEAREAWHVIRRSVARIYFDSLRQEMASAHALRQTSALLHHKSVVTTERYLGMDTERQARNESLRGKPFILGEPVLSTR